MPKNNVAGNSGMPLSANLWGWSPQSYRERSEPAPKQRSYRTTKQNFFFFKFLKFTWKIGNRLIRKKNQFSDFFDFYFSSYGHFSVIFLKKSPQFSMITRKIKIGNFFNNFSRSIQNIAHHLQSLFDGVTFEGGGGLHVLK